MFFANAIDSKLRVFVQKIGFNTTYINTKSEYQQLEQNIMLIYTRTSFDPATRIALTYGTYICI